MTKGLEIALIATAAVGTTVVAREVIQRIADRAFDPWVYDLNEDGYIDEQEVLKATQDHLAGIITKRQLDKVILLWQNGVHAED